MLVPRCRRRENEENQENKREREIKTKSLHSTEDMIYSNNPFFLNPQTCKTNI
jgi:hypothetical protein